MLGAELVVALGGIGQDAKDCSARLGEGDATRLSDESSQAPCKAATWAATDFASAWRW